MAKIKKLNINNEVFYPLTHTKAVVDNSGKIVDELLNEKIDKISIVNDLTTGGADKALSAEMGKILNHEFENMISPSVSSDLDISDEEGNVIMQLKNGHIHTKNFNSDETTTELDGKVSTINNDFNIADDEGNIIASFSKGGLRTKEFDSEVSIMDVEYPLFIGKSINSTGAVVDSTSELVTPLIRAVKGDVVKVKYPQKIFGIKVFEYYKDGSSSSLTNSEILTTGEYVVQKENTRFVRIVGIPSETDNLLINGVIYGNASFVGNVHVIHRTHGRKDIKLFVDSTIPSGWYISTKSEFSTTPTDNDVWESTGEKLTLQDIYSTLQTLSEDYKDYFRLTQLGYDSSFGKNAPNIAGFEPWKDTDGNLKIPIYKFEMLPIPVNSHIDNTRGHDNSATPTIYLQFGIHASEAPIIRAMLNFITHVCRDWRNDDFLTYIRWNCRIVGIPVLVPYSYVDLTSQTVNGRCNYNGVNINRNYYAGGTWETVVESTGNAKGSNYLSEVETKISSRLLLENADAIAAYDFHTLGVFDDPNMIIAIAGGYAENEFIKSVGFEVIKNLTTSGWRNHNLPTSVYDGSGYIGVYQDEQAGGAFGQLWQDINMPLCSAEGLYQYYKDGTSKTVYNTHTDCMNEELIANLVLGTLRNYYKFNN